MDQEIYDFLVKHLKSVQENDIPAYHATTGEDLTLYEWWVTPHRQDGLDFHRFMIEHRWAGEGDYRYDLLEPRLQLYDDTAIVSYTFMLSRAKPDGGVEHRTHNESRVLIKRDGQWQIVHVHKSPAWSAPFEPK